MNSKSILLLKNSYFVFIIFLLLSACEPAPIPTPTPTATRTLLPTLTSTIKPSDTITPTITTTIQPTLTATETSTITPTQICLQLLTPADGSELSNTGKMVFTWKSMVNADYYKIVIILPNGKEISFSSKVTQYSRYAESLLLGGEFKWKIIALNTNGNELCSSLTFSFNKDELPFTETPNSNAESGGKNGISGPPPPGPGPIPGN